MADLCDVLPCPVRLSTLCSQCGEACTWYRLPDLLFGLCPEHGRVEELAVKPLTPLPDEPP